MGSIFAGIVYSNEILFQGFIDGGVDIHVHDTKDLSVHFLDSDGNEIVIADIMTTTLSGDHRVANGAEGAKFLETFKNILENPTFINI